VSFIQLIDFISMLSHSKYKVLILMQALARKSKIYSSCFSNAFCRVCFKQGRFDFLVSPRYLLIFVEQNFGTIAYVFINLFSSFSILAGLKAICLDWGAILFTILTCASEGVTVLIPCGPHLFIDFFEKNGIF
jgi:hypothetical protein